MASYHKDNISLYEAMTMKLPYVTRVWDIPGLQVQDKNIPDNAKVDRTFVMNHTDSKTTVGVEYTLEGDKSCYMASVAEYPAFNLERLREEFPVLFKLTGNLYAFGEK